jgi:hypothetical protein
VKVLSPSSEVLVRIVATAAAGRVAERVVGDLPAVLEASL